ncbi:MAG: hypothetical protein ACYDCK_13115 [Thermoplasmatota archaeon]
MTSREFARDLHGETHVWEMEGIITTEAGEALRARYPMTAAPPRAESVTSTLPYAVAGALLGAAAIAFVQVGLRIDDATLPLLGEGLVLAGVGVALRVTMPRTQMQLLGDTLLAAGLVALAVSSFPPSAAVWATELAAFAGIAGGLAALWWRRDGTFVPVFAFVAATAALQRYVARLDVAHLSTLFLLSGLALAAVTLALDALVRKRENVVLGALSAAGIAVPLVLFVGDQFPGIASTSHEMLFGAVVLVGLVVAAVARRRGLSVGFGAALAVDAILLAFDNGGVLTGTVTLVAVAGLLIWQAEVLRRFFSS